MLVESEVREALAEALEVDLGQLVPEAVLVDTVPDYDSLRMVQLVAVMSERFGIVVDVDRMIACQTVRELVDVIRGDTQHTEES